jgi:hypothetical protein
VATAYRSHTSATTGNASTGTTLAVTKPTGTVSGDMLVAIAWMGLNGNIATLGVGTSGFTDSGVAYTAPNSGPKLKVFYKAAGSSEPTSYTFGMDAVGSGTIELICISGAASAQFDVTPVTNSAVATTTPHTAASATATAAGDFLITSWCAQVYSGGIQTQGVTNWTPQAGMTEVADIQSAYCRSSSAYQQLSATGASGTRTATYTIGNSATPDGNYAAVTILVKPDAPTFSGSATATMRLNTTGTTGGKSAAASQTATALKLAASPTGSKTVAGSYSPNLRLAAAASAAKTVPASVSASALILSASSVGQRINLGLAILKLAASSAAPSHDSAAASTATLRLTATSVDASVRANAATASPLKLVASAAQASARTGTASSSLHLAASQVAAKNVPAALGAALRLLASESATKNTPAGLSAALRLLASLSGLTSTHGATVTATALRLSASPGAPGSVRVSIVTAAALRLSAVGLGVHLVTEVTSAALTARAQITVPYELVCVARIPQTSGAPALIQVDPIDWTGLSQVDELSKPQQLTVGTKIASITEPVLQRLRNLSELATELWLYRNGKLVFAGPLLGGQVQGEALTLQAQGLLAYAKMMVVASDQVFTAVDQFTIAATLIDQWQNLDYGNFGIDTSSVGVSGVTRDATYLAKELNQVGQRLEEMGKRINGFDLAVDPASRKLRLSYPIQGVDRSSGEDAIVFDSRNVTSPNIVFSAAPGDVASEGFGTGTGTASGATTLFSTKSNLVRRAQYGRSAVTATYSDVSVQATLDDYVQGLLDVRNEALLIPGPDVRVTPDSDLSAYDVGDTVSYQLHAQLSVQGTFRLRKRTVNVSNTGQESVSVAFV